MMRLFVLFLLFPIFLQAAVLTWDGGNGTDPSNPIDGGGTWNLDSATRWFIQAGSPPYTYQVWNNDLPDSAIFGVGTGTAGTVTLGTHFRVAHLTFNTTDSGNYTLNGNSLTLVGAPVITTHANASINSSLAGDSGWTKQGTGNLTLGGNLNNPLTGTVTVAAGTLTLNKTSGALAISGDVIVESGATLAWASNHGQLPATSSVTLNGGSIIFNSRDVTLTNYTQTAGGQTGNNGGIVQITGTMAMSGGTLMTLNSGAQWTVHELDLTGYSTAGNALYIAGANADKITTFTIGAGGLTMSGQTLSLVRITDHTQRGNELRLNGDVTATGINQIIPNSNGVLGALAVNQLQLGDGIRTWNIISDTTTITLPIAGTGEMIKAGEGTIYLAGVFSNLYTGLTTVQAGMLRLNKTGGATALAGDVQVTGGTLRWDQPNQIADDATIIVNGGTLNPNGLNETFAHYIQTSGPGLSAGNTGAINITGSAIVSGGGSVTINSGGQMRVNSIDFTGFTGLALNFGGNHTSDVTRFTVGPGGIILGNNQSISMNRTVTANAKGAALVLEGNLTANGVVTFSASVGNGVAEVQLVGNRTWDIQSGTTTSNLPLVGYGSGLIKTGAGTLTLNGVNSYTGKTTISQGSLRLGTASTLMISSWIQVDASAELNVSAITSGFLYAPDASYDPDIEFPVISGTGTITGSLIIGGAAQIRPGTTSLPSDSTTAGDGTGTLTVTGSLIFNPDMNSTVAHLNILSASSADKIQIGGDLVLNEASFFTVTLDDSYTPNWGDSWTLLDWSGLLTADTFSAGANNRTGRNSDGNEGNLDLPDLSDYFLLWEISNFTGVNGSLVITIVPEPSRALLMLVAGGTMLMRRRRR